MKINAFNTSRFRNAEFDSLGTDVLKITKDFDWAGLQVGGFYTNVSTAVQNFEDQLNKMNTVPETMRVEKADLFFNNSWRAFKIVCKAYLLSPSAEKRMAAKVLINLSKIHGYNMHTESYQEQNAKAKMFLADCESIDEVKEAILTMGIQEFISNVQDALNMITLNIGNRKSKSSKQISNNDTKMLRQKLDLALDGMFKYMESMSGLVVDSPFDVMIKNINESIQKIETIHKTRDSRNTEEASEPLED